MLRRIFGRKRDEVTGGWKKSHNEELHGLYTSPDIKGIKTRRMTWTGNVTRTGETKNANKILVGKADGKKHSEDPGVDGKIILKLILGE
jgi:hypothetical protein